ncbi:MAG: hypothetical protein ACHQT6_00530 [Candidatus Acidiferrales bacterium]
MTSLSDSTIECFGFLSDFPSILVNSSSQKILLNPLISVLFGPQGQGNRRQVVDHRNGILVFSSAVIESIEQLKDY